jgi:hypothetical protein
MDDEANEIWRRMKARGKIRADLIKRGESISLSDATKAMIIDGYPQYRDLQRLYQLNKDRMALANKAENEAQRF